MPVRVDVILVLDVQYLRADLTFGRAVLATLLGISEHGRSCGQFEAIEVPVVSGSGLERVACDGEMGREGHRIPVPQRAEFTVYWCRGGLTADCCEPAGVVSSRTSR